MARIDKSVLGFVSGKLGEFVFRKMNGGKFVSLSPDKYKISQSAEAKTGRANFAATVKFAKFINSIPELKEIWSTARIEGTNSYHRIIKYNAKRVNSGKLTTANKIIPEGQILTISSISLKEENQLELNILLPHDKINFPAELYLIFAFHKDVILKQNLIIENKAEEYTLNIPLNNIIISKLANFPNPLIYITILGEKINKEEIFWTSSAAIEWVD